MRFSEKNIPGSLNHSLQIKMADEVDDTIFGKIVRKEIPAKFLHEDEQCVVIKDIHPQAPHHFLVVSVKELRKLEDAAETDQKLLGHMMWVATKVAKEIGITNGYRIVINDGHDGGQNVYHLHLHVLGGRKMNWPPG
ncbi:adenosine 5'-monophosphoramidase HINT1-like [Mercenaria mercenaria]|uniref:adenosine 5'-monophosphoramidase HINT1-like n=1 Tax=Mercenaria mercenaria TaxID=6596 RepID=UPI00234F5D57|nr:adenosine 5'-monophosphoramidase HINT1-like [Mercenaria mercenaria]